MNKYFVITLLVLLIIILYIITSLVQVYYYIKVGKKIAQDSKKFERLIPNASINILFLGDSTAVGTGVKNKSESTAGRFALSYPKAHIENVGVNGNKLEDVAKTLKPKKKHYNLTIIQAGGNDIIRMRNVDDSRVYLKQILENVTSISDNVLVLHSGNIGTAPFFPRWISWLFTKRTKEFREMYKEEIKHFDDVYYVDLFKERRQDPFLEDVNKFYAKDYLHLTGEGYKMWFEEQKKIIDEEGLL